MLHGAKKCTLPRSKADFAPILETQFQQGAGYVDRKRRQACRPAVQYPTKLQLVINHEIAKALNLTIP